MAVPRRFISLAWRAALAVAVFAATWAATAAAAEHPSFKAHVFPIIRENCLECHRPGGLGYEASGLDLRTYEGLMRGTKYGPIVVPGDSFTSNLNVVIEGRVYPGIRMPYHGKNLTRWERVLIRRWVNRGARDN